MPKVKTYEIDKREKYRIIGEFFDVIAELNSKKEVIDFFIGLLTPSESLMMARRIQIAKMLLEEANYEQISKKLRVGFETINKTDKWLHSGNDDYDNWISKHISNSDKSKNKRGNERDRYASLLDRYPGHRLLRDLFGL